MGKLCNQRSPMVARMGWYWLVSLWLFRVPMMASQLLLRELKVPSVGSLMTTTVVMRKMFQRLPRSSLKFPMATGLLYRRRGR